MSELVRMISSDGTLTVIAAETTDIVKRMKRIHQTSPVTSVALGRLITAASMMGAVLKGKDNSITLRINGGGPAGSLIAVSDSAGNVRGYVSEPVVEDMLNDKGRLDVAGAVGKEGTLTVMKDLGMKEPYIGQIPLVSGEIAEDITSYFAISEQLPSVCALGVALKPSKAISVAGGFIIQLLPTAMDDTIDKVEECLKGIEPITQMLSNGMTPEEICRHVLKGFDLEILDTSTPEYKCNCSKERTEKALLTLGREELLDMANDPQTEVSCHFCEKKYLFTPDEIRNMAERA
ncbi:MAG: Hsp33 family molecular chaperone HslO [Clostridia bacterium]|nr:Hsp33 family molecular chaperone HslO [Clostridia bacterium]